MDGAAPGLTASRRPADDGESPDVVTLVGERKTVEERFPGDVVAAEDCALLQDVVTDNGVGLDRPVACVFDEPRIFGENARAIVKLVVVFNFLVVGVPGQEIELDFR